MSRCRGGGVTLPIVVALALACVALLVAPLAQAGAHDGHPGAKAKRSKACKKKRKRSGQCRRRDRQHAPGVVAARTVTLTWDSAANIDLQVYDLEKRHAGLQNGTLVNGIPGATHSGDDSDGFGPETFTDPSGRRVGYLVCYRSGPAANVTLVDDGFSGGTYTATLGPTDPGQSYSTARGWGFLPIGAHC